MDPLRLLQLRGTIQGTKEFIECETPNYKQQGAFTSCNFKLNCFNTGLFPDVLILRLTGAERGWGRILLNILIPKLS